MERLHKLLAHAGIGSRRACEQYILDGRVTVNGKICTTLGVKADPAKDKILFDGKQIKKSRHLYYLLHKPKGVCCTNAAKSHVPRAIDFIPEQSERLYTVGRLDIDSEGLLLITNDGNITQKLTHPSFKIPKTYEVYLDSSLTPQDIKKIEKGVGLSEGKTGKSRLKIKKRAQNKTILEITVKEGRNRLVRRIFARQGYKVRRLKRISIGSLQLEKLKPGQCKKISAARIRKLL